MTHPYEFLDTDDVRQLLLGFKLAICATLDREAVQFIEETFARFSHNESCSPPVQFIFNQLADLPEPKRPKLRLVGPD
jgi:hypothetical protein